LQRCWRPALQSSRRAGRATGASAGVHDHRRPEARPRVTKRRAGGVIQQKAPARREAWGLVTKCAWGASQSAPIRPVARELFNITDDREEAGRRPVAWVQCQLPASQPEGSPALCGSSRGSRSSSPTSFATISRSAWSCSTCWLSLSQASAMFSRRNLSCASVTARACVRQSCALRRNSFGSLMQDDVVLIGTNVHRARNVVCRSSEGSLSAKIWSVANGTCPPTAELFAQSEPAFPPPVTGRHRTRAPTRYSPGLVACTRRLGGPRRRQGSALVGLT
jgi:hypothetical protein